MDRFELERRTKRFAVSVIRFVGELPRSKAADVLGRQLLRSSTSIGANYREATRSLSRSDFLYKINLVEKEASETRYWLELLDEVRLGDPEHLAALLQESHELLAIFTRIGSTTKHNSLQAASYKTRTAPPNSKS